MAENTGESNLSQEYDQHRHRIKRLFIVIGICWTIVIVGIFTIEYHETHSAFLGIACGALVESLEKDMCYRQWVTSHGGVYVPGTSDTPPNPYLAHIPERDIATPSGKKLTLVNPAYMTRQVHELAQKQYGHKGHITSLQLLRPENKADEWEAHALQSFEQGEKDKLSLGVMDGELYLRLMRPFITAEGCLKCHASQGYKVGDIRGGISVSLPWAPVEQAIYTQVHFYALGFSGIWLLGVVGILWARNVVLSNLEDRRRAEQDRMELERQILHARKQESLGLMAGGVAHDFNNSLQAILGNLELAQSNVPPDSKPARFLLKAVEATEKSAKLSAQMLAYTGLKFFWPETINLNALLTDLADAMRATLSGAKTLHLQLQNGVPSIQGDSLQLQRLVTNLVSNAAEAIDDKGGDIWLTTGEMYCDEGYLDQSFIVTRPAPGRFAIVEVRDSGSGMDKETQQKLFDPFFTSKSFGRGLGMPEVMGIVKGHNGAIMVESEVGKGTTIRVLFPVVE